jgi:CheY-like chemotaxis protein/nitrogen-specific signal transduction histidine kinase/HPt (histidine-containing phosphotransfer) domain-containing protein
MNTNNINDLIKTIPSYAHKEKLVQLITKLQKNYQKSTDDKLAVTHLLSKVNRELEESLNNEKKFIASVSHELRTPLTAILGYSELFEDTILNNKQTRYLANITQSSNHLLSLISDLLDVAKLEDNRIELSPREFDLDDLLTECSNITKARVSKEVEFTTDIPLLDYSIIGDDKRMKQIFLNLLSNATKFTKKGSIKFYVQQLKELKDNKLRLIINVEDTGTGIPKEIKENLFEPFQSTDKTQGTGLGLFISHRLADLMNGDITFETVENVGTTFSVSVEVEISEKKEIGKGLKGSNIILFGESNDFTHKLSRELNELGVNFQQHDARDQDLTTPLAQMIISGKFNDIGIIDYALFKAHSNSVAGTFKAVNPNIKLIILSEDDDHEFVGFDLIIKKPISHQKIIKRFEELYIEEFFNEPETKDYSTLKVLVVEDVELNREYEKEMLDNFFSISCDTAENGKIALEKVKKNHYDIILMDMRMPVMNGLEATKEIRKFNTDIPIICMSANVYKEDKIAAEESGMNHFIEKPLNKNDIAEKLAIYTGKEYKKSILKKNATIVSNKKPEEDNYASLSLKYLLGNFEESIAKRLHKKAMNNIVEYLQRIDINFKNKHSKGLLEDFHALKGVLANIGLKSMEKQAGELQILASRGEIMAIFIAKKVLLKDINLLLTQAKEK